MFVLYVRTRLLFTRLYEGEAARRGSGTVQPVDYPGPRIPAEG